MAYRLFHLADLHLDRVFSPMGCRAEIARQRRYGLRSLLKRAGQTAIEMRCDAMTFGGDLYEHNSADISTGRFLAETFAALQPLPIFLAPGNHDPLLPHSLYATVEWPENVHLFTQPRLQPVPLQDGLTLWGLGYRDPTWSGDPLDHDRVGGDGGIHVALFHGAEMASRPDGKSVHGPFRAERIADLGFAFGLCGHYHGQRIDKELRFTYPGSPEPLAFDENGERGAVILDIDDRGTVTCTAVALNEWQAYSLECDVADATSLDAVIDRVVAVVDEKMEMNARERSLVRVMATGDLAPDVPIDVAIVESVVREKAAVAAFRFLDTTHLAVDAAAFADDATARGLFVRDMVSAIDGASNDSAQQQLMSDALRYGMQALSGVEVRVG